MKNKILIAFLTIILSSCARYQLAAVKTKITTIGNKIHIEQIGKPVPIKDTTIIGQMIIRQKY